MSLKPRVCYSGYFGANSGMGQACRTFIKSLYMAGIEMVTELIPNIKAKVDLGNEFQIAKNLHGKKLDYNIKIIHITPNLILKHLEPMKYHIFHLFWETDRLPKWWVWSLNLCDEIWTGSEYNKKAFERSGVKKPINIFPQPIDVTIKKPKPFKILGHEGFLFYSIFQWIERKDWKTLISAYCQEFEKDGNVGLLLKTYKERFTHEETRQILEEIAFIKGTLKQKHFPPIYLYAEEMDRQDILRIHQTGDCFVLPHRGEGWGICEVEASLMGKPVITTNLSGVHDHLPEDTYYPLNSKLVNVFNMDFVPWYERNQKWGQVDVGELRDKMRHAFSNRKENKERAKKAQKFVIENFNYKMVGDKMKKRLEQIVEKMDG